MSLPALEAAPAGEWDGPGRPGDQALPLELGTEAPPRVTPWRGGCLNRIGVLQQEEGGSG